MECQVNLAVLLFGMSSKLGIANARKDLLMMDKEKILEQSRKENLLHDEGEMDAQNRGNQWGSIGFLFLCAVVILYHLAIGVDNFLPVVFLLGYIACGAFGRYAARKKKIDFIVGLLCMIATAADLLFYVMNTLPH